jgi:hypothetical protein
LVLFTSAAGTSGIFFPVKNVQNVKGLEHWETVMDDWYHKGKLINNRWK